MVLNDTPARGTEFTIATLINFPIGVQFAIECFMNCFVAICAEALLTKTANDI